MYPAYITKEDVDKRIMDRWNNEYVRSGDYKAIDQKIDILHTKCNHTFSMYVNQLIKHKTIPCPYCNPHSIKDTDIYKYQLFQQFGDEYELIGEYNGSLNELEIRHNPCGTIFTPYASAMLAHREKCPYCFIGSKRMNTDIFIRKTYDVHGPDYEVIGEYIGTKNKIAIRHICGYEYEVYPINFLSGNNKCPLCSKKTHLDTESYSILLDRKYNGHLHLCSEYKASKKKVTIQCMDCNNMFEMNPYHLLYHIGQCPYCGKGISYPEKVIRNILEQLNIEYIAEYNCSNADWCSSFRYDFYLPFYNCIIEVNGKQHYNDWTWQPVEITQENDLIKMNLAKEHVKTFIVIDARVSNIKWIKEHIETTELKNMLDLTKIDWEVANQAGLTTYNSKVIELFIAGYDRHKIANELHLSLTTVDRYIRSYKNSISLNNIA